MPEIKPCPSAHALALFGQGKLSEAQAATVAAHLEICGKCREAVAGQRPGSFEEKVRAARPGTSSLSSSRPGAGASVMGKGKAPAAGAPGGVPPELADHPKFRVLRELGRGGMGVIYLAEHRVMEKPVALKVISPAVLDNPDALARFRAEVKAAGKLDHPNIARAYDADQAGELHYLVMEFVEGVSLAQLLERKGPMTVSSACHAVCQAALGLQHASEKGMAHRDIKPQNLMLTPQGVVKVLDFGLARLGGEPAGGRRLTRLESFMGTPEYVAPEQATDARAADVRADIYSLGCTLYALLAGRPPFTGATASEVVLSHVEKEATPLHEVRPDVPAELSAVVTRMLAKDPAQRHQTPKEVAQALLRFAKAPGKAGGASGVAVSPASSAGTGTRVGGDTGRMKGPGAATPKLSVKAAPATAEEEKGPPLENPAEAPARGTAARKAKGDRVEARRPPAVWWVRPAALAGVGLAALALALAGIIVWIKYTNPKGNSTELGIAVSSGDSDTQRAATPHASKGPADTSKVGNPEEVGGNGGASMSDSPPESEGEWLRKVAALPAEQQVEAVKAVLPERNPGFKGAVKARIENGVVTEIEMDGTEVHDLSPLLAFAGLRTLDCSCATPWQSPLTDLSPLSRIPLRSLRYPYHTWLGAEQLRPIKTLETINEQPAATFWEKVGDEAAESRRFCQMVAKLSPQAQVNAVADQLKRRNPDFDGKVSHYIDSGAVTSLTFCTDNVTDISPVRALTELRALGCFGSPNRSGRLADLSPLKGLPLTYLSCGATKVSDLSPLKGMPLTSLVCRATKVSDLSPLKGMPLPSLICGDTEVSDLSPLKGMPLTVLDCGATKVSDLSPLKGMPLTLLTCGATKVSDLSPLKGMPLTHLDCSATKVSDLSPLKGMPLRFLFCGATKVSDLSPLKGMPLNKMICWDTAVSDLTPLQGIRLEQCGFTPKNITKGIGAIRQMKSLQKISLAADRQFPTEEFWRRYDAGEFNP